MAKSLPYGIVPHGFYWQLLGQKSSHKKSYQTEILATTVRTILTRAVALRDGLIILWRPNMTSHVFCHQIIICMESMMI
jgi:hypothetical protein